METQGGLEVDNHGMQLDKDCLWGMGMRSYMECKVCYQVIWIRNEFGLGEKKFKGKSLVKKKKAIRMAWTTVIIDGLIKMVTRTVA